MNRSDILEGIRDQIGRENLFNGNAFTRRRCSVNLTGVSEDDRVVVDLDKVFPSGRIGENQCECILFYFDAATNFVVVPMELKGGRNAEAEKAIRQLKNGAAFADDYTPRDVRSICHPILFCQSINKLEYRQLKKPQSKVAFGGERFEIKTARCGDKLANVLP